MKIGHKKPIMLKWKLVIRTNKVKVKINEIQQNSKCRLHGGKDELVNHIISKCSKLTQKGYEMRHDWVDKIIHWELHKSLNSEHTIKRYMHNSECMLENET